MVTGEPCSCEGHIGCVTREAPFPHQHNNETAVWSENQEPTVTLSKHNRNSYLQDASYFISVFPGGYDCFSRRLGCGGGVGPRQHRRDANPQPLWPISL